MKTVTKPVKAGTPNPSTAAAVQVLKPGNRQIISKTKFGQDGCGY